MLYRIQRHPIPVEAYFDWSLALVFAVPGDQLRPLLTPGLTLDQYEDYGFVAVAMVETKGLRPSWVPPFFGRSFFLTGYRIFTRFETKEGRRLRGLKILRSETDKPLMVLAGNALTHYGYRLGKVSRKMDATGISVEIVSRDGYGDLKLTSSITEAKDLPTGSPFPDFRTARRFAGPMPYTFEYEKETHSVIRIEGKRKQWKPIPVDVSIEHLSFFKQSVFDGMEPVLANAFLVRDVSYQWQPGIIEQVESRE